MYPLQLIAAFEGNYSCLANMVSTTVSHLSMNNKKQHLLVRVQTTLTEQMRNDSLTQYHNYSKVRTRNMPFIFQMSKIVTAIITNTIKYTIMRVLFFRLHGQQQQQQMYRMFRYTSMHRNRIQAGESDRQKNQLFRILVLCLK